MNCMNARYSEIPTGSGVAHIHINYDEKGPRQIFVNLPPIGTEISTSSALLGVMISKYLELGGDPKKVIKHLQSARCDKQGLHDGVPVFSVGHAIAIALKHLMKENFHEQDQEEKPLTDAEIAS